MTSSMFRNYQNLDGYIPDNRTCKQLNTPVHKLPLEEFNYRGEFIGYSWRQHDTILLEFATEGNVLYHDPDVYEDAETYLSGDRQFLIEFFNFRYEMIFSAEVPASNDLKYFIPPELCKLLIPGTYELQVTLIDPENDVHQTLLDRSDLKIFVR